jgi:hypothetical protein
MKRDLKLTGDTFVKRPRQQLAAFFRNFTTGSQVLRERKNRAKCRIGA